VIKYIFDMKGQFFFLYMQMLSPGWGEDPGNKTLGKLDDA
jgi:hypothetical protein